MGQDVNDAFTGPYGPGDPAANLAHSMVTNAGGNLNHGDDDGLSPEAEASIRRGQDAVKKVGHDIGSKVVSVFKGKTPPKPDAPKPPDIASKKTSDYAIVRAARK